MGPDELLSIINTIAGSIDNKGPMLNERYLHHYFTHILQTRSNMLDLTEKNQQLNLHPEWPTYKKQTELDYGRYRRHDGEYFPTQDGSAGFIDFAIGDYSAPEIGIEFSLKSSWSHEEATYDYLKLMDAANPFKTAVSLNILMRKNELSSPEALETKSDEAYGKAKCRLGTKLCGDQRRLFFIVTEIAQDNHRRHWHLNRRKGIFEQGLPQIT